MDHAVTVHTRPPCSTRRTTSSGALLLPRTQCCDWQVVQLMSLMPSTMNFPQHWERYSNMTIAVSFSHGKHGLRARTAWPTLRKRAPHGANSLCRKENTSSRARNSKSRRSQLQFANCVSHEFKVDVCLRNNTQAWSVCKTFTHTRIHNRSRGNLRGHRLDRIPRPPTHPLPSDHTSRIELGDAAQE
jgi:hypothetical protein